jgi:hypothetical protein
LGEVIEDALRVSFAANRKALLPHKAMPLKTFRGNGLQPGVDLASSASLLESMEGR